jgi:hypothetical protein
MEKTLALSPRSSPLSIPSISADVDVDLLIARLAGPLTFHAGQAFRRAAEEALARVPCLGEGAVYRAIAPLQRAFFDPPDDHRAAWDITYERTRASSRTSKLIAAPAIEHDRRRRRQLRVVG